MGNNLQIAEKQLELKLNSALSSASSIITKSYLECLESYDLIDPKEKEIDIDISDCGRFYRLSKLVLNRKECILDKLTTIVNVASSIQCSLATIIHSDGDHIDYYFAIISKHARINNFQEKNRRNANAAAFEGALSGNLMGSELQELTVEEVQQFRDTYINGTGHCISSVSGVVALRDENEKSMESYVQGIENLVDALQGQAYTILMIADPVDTSEIQVIKQGYEVVHTQLSALAERTVTINESTNESESHSTTEGFTKGITEGISMTQSRTESSGSSFGQSIGGNFGGSIGFMGTGIHAGIQIGVNSGRSFGTSTTDGRTTIRQNMKQDSHSSTDGTSTGTSTGKSLQVSVQNRSVKYLLDKIDKHIERLDMCDSFGAFDCAAYVIADSRETSLTVASNYNALMRGQESSVQSSHINTWYQPEKVHILSKYLQALSHPRFYADKEHSVVVRPSSIISGAELAIQIGLPKKSISGITVVPMATFGRNINSKKEHCLSLGNLFHMGHDDGTAENRKKVEIDIEKLCMHTFITGSTGSGKTTAIYAILDKLMESPVQGCEQQNVKFMVIEPAKGEYKDRFGYYDNVKVYGTNYKKTPLLRVNPFSFPEDIHVLEHIERLIEIFNVCWPMYAAMPAVLKDSIERAYIAAGWNLNTSECRYHDAKGQPLFPNFVDVLNQINIVVNESQYSSDSKGDYKGALCTRLKSLTNGLYGQIFTSDEIPAEELFDENVIIDLSRTGSAETRSLLMGLLVMKLQEYHMANVVAGNQPLKHVTVLEEAHNILKRTSMEQSNESSNVQGKAVEMLANSIAEMRTYGEGFIIADQTPGLMDMSVIRNTNTKIILRLPDRSDRELVGYAAGMNEEQIGELSRLNTFVAAVYQNDWLEPVLCSIDTNFKVSKKYEMTTKHVLLIHNKNEILRFILGYNDVRDKIDRAYIDKIVEDCFKLPISAEVKVAFIKYLKATEKAEVQCLRGRILYEIFNSDMAFGLAELYQSNLVNWYAKMCEVLEPEITMFTENEQQKIIATLVRERAVYCDTPENIEFYNRLMKFM